MRVYEAIARKAHAVLNGDRIDWIETFYQEAKDLIDDYMPHGSGIDGTTEINYDKTTCKVDRLVISSSYHVMKDGYYVRWIDFDIIIKPSLMWGMDLSISGQFGKDQDVKEYLAELFHEALYAKIADCTSIVPIIK